MGWEGRRCRGAGEWGRSGARLEGRSAGGEGGREGKRGGDGAVASVAGGSGRASETGGSGRNPTARPRTRGWVGRPGGRRLRRQRREHVPVRLAFDRPATAGTVSSSPPSRTSSGVAEAVVPSDERASLAGLKAAEAASMPGRPETGRNGARRVAPAAAQEGHRSPRPHQPTAAGMTSTGRSGSSGPAASRPSGWQTSGRLSTSAPDAKPCRSPPEQNQPEPARLPAVDRAAPV